MKKIMLTNLVTKTTFKSSMKRMGARMDKLATKEELNLAVNKLDSRMDKLEDRMDRLKDYVDYRFNEFEKIVYTKADHQIFMTWMDEAMKELRAARDGRVLTEGQMLRLDDKVVNHESRICILERK